MRLEQLVRDRVHDAYWCNDWNCAVTTLRVLAEVFDVTLHQQLLHAAVGMHGAGGYGAQCGLVEGGLMLIGMLGAAQRLADDTVADTCRAYAEAFGHEFGSLLCRELRPGGFQAGDPPHLCEDLTRNAIMFDADFISRALHREEGWARTGACALEPSPEQMNLSHVDDEGRIHMVSVGHKPNTERVAVAQGEVRMQPGTLRLIAAGDAPKGDVLATAQVAGIMAAKRTHHLIPLCHPLSLTKVDVDFEMDEPSSRIRITATVCCTGQTGVEMEALTAVSVAALTIYDMAKAVERTMQIGRIQLVRKSGGKSGTWTLSNEGSSINDDKE